MGEEEERGGEQYVDIVELIRRRAFEISQGPDAGTAEENWVRAEQELRVGNHEDLRDALDDARDAESATLLRAEIQVFGHP